MQTLNSNPRAICVRSERAGQRVMESVTQFSTGKLRLKINEAKSAVAQPETPEVLIGLSRWV